MSGSRLGDVFERLWRLGLPGSRPWGARGHAWPQPWRALVAAIFARAVRDALGADWRPVDPADAASARVFLASEWAVALAWAVGLDAAAIRAGVERTLADPVALARARLKARALGFNPRAGHGVYPDGRWERGHAV